MPQQIGTDYRAWIPSLPEDADIVQALRDYHLGPNSEPGIEDYLKSKLNALLVDNKGDIVVGGDTEPETLSAPSVAGYVLETDPSTETGLAWKQSSREQEQIAHIMGVY